MVFSGSIGSNVKMGLVIPRPCRADNKITKSVIFHRWIFSVAKVFLSKFAQSALAPLLFSSCKYRAPSWQPPQFSQKKELRENVHSQRDNTLTYFSISYYFAGQNSTMEIENFTGRGGVANHTKHPRPRRWLRPGSMVEWCDASFRKLLCRSNWDCCWGGSKFVWAPPSPEGGVAVIAPAQNNLARKPKVSQWWHVYFHVGTMA